MHGARDHRASFAWNWLRHFFSLLVYLPVNYCLEPMNINPIVPLPPTSSFATLAVRVSWPVSVSSACIIVTVTTRTDGERPRK